jgi:hypothetical protein
MNKVELIKTHLALFQVKQFLEQNQIACDFSKYIALNISPMHVHKSRKQHRKAILLLGKAISEALTKYRENSPPIAEKAIAYN